MRQLKIPWEATRNSINIYQTSTSGTEQFTGMYTTNMFMHVWLQTSSCIEYILNLPIPDQCNMWVLSYRYVHVLC